MMAMDFDSTLPSSYFGEADGDPSARIRLLMKLRTCGVRDTDVLRAIEETPREKFVADTFTSHAYDDTALPIACGQTISQPTVVAQMTAALNLTDRHTVLEIGTGCGYQTAILSRLARRVYTIERHRELMDEAAARFTRMNFTNIVTRVGDGSKGWREVAPFDRIIVTAAADEVPPIFLEQLRAGGVMVIPVGAVNGQQTLMRIHKDLDGNIHEQALMAVRFVPLVAG